MIDEVIEEEGPFEGVFCFSQGSATLVSYLLEWVEKDPTEPLPFRFAIICSPTIPLAGDPAYCQSIINSIDSADEARIRSSKDEEIAQLTGAVHTAIKSLVTTIDKTEGITRQPRSFFLDRDLSDVPWALHPELCSQRICLPSLHVSSKQDLYTQEESAIVRSFFQSGTTRVFEHSAGHDIPRSGSEVGQLLSAMEWVASQSLLPTHS